MRPCAHPSWGPDIKYVQITLSWEGRFPCALVRILAEHPSPSYGRLACRNAGLCAGGRRRGPRDRAGGGQRPTGAGRAPNFLLRVCRSLGSSQSLTTPCRCSGLLSGVPSSSRWITYRTGILAFPQPRLRGPFCAIDSCRRRRVGRQAREQAWNRSVHINSGRVAPECPNPQRRAFGPMACRRGEQGERG